jgi:hypothetical protein
MLQNRFLPQAQFRCEVDRQASATTLTNSAKRGTSY